MSPEMTKLKMEAEMICARILAEQGEGGGDSTALGTDLVLWFSGTEDSCWACATTDDKTAVFLNYVLKAMMEVYGGRGGVT